jgi:transcriptional regulator with XRE-family HTH domain
VPSADELRSARRRAFGNAIRARRQELGLSQEQLADRAGIERKSVSRVETGAYSPSVDRLWNICDALGVLPRALLEDDDSPQASARTVDVEPQHTKALANPGGGESRTEA